MATIADVTIELRTGSRRIFVYSPGEQMENRKAVTITVNKITQFLGEKNFKLGKLNNVQGFSSREIIIDEYVKVVPLVSYLTEFEKAFGAELEITK